MQRTILVAGGAGYIGSHFCHVAAEHGFVPVVVDSIQPAHGALERYRLASSERFLLEICDIADERRISEIIGHYRPCAAVCFAALIDVEQSTREPARYWSHNYEKFKRFVDCLLRAEIRYLLFSSTAAVYSGHSNVMLLSEGDLLAPTHAYGQSKLACEIFLQGNSPNHNMASSLTFPSPMASGPAPLSTVVFRYFNAAGAAPQFGLGEVHNPETHLIPKALSATLAPPSRRMAQALTINGADYPTADGTCVRDYVHVLDLAEAHLLGLRYLLAGGSSDVFNLGSGSGATIREIVAAIERTTGAAVPYRIGPRRAGDSPRLVANIGKAGRVLGWRPRYQLEDIISSAAQFHGAQQLSG